MLDELMRGITDHWFLSTYLSVMVFNESAILATFSLLEVGDSVKFWGATFAVIAGALTNDLILYVLARYGFYRFAATDGRSTGKLSSQSIFENIFLGNIFLSLLFIKFLFGVRIILTIYIVVKQRLSIGKFIAYDLCGVVFYVLVIGSIGLLVGHGIYGTQEMYSLIVRVISALCLLILTTTLISRLLKKWY